MKNDKKPQIRFKGFTDDWEQREVQEIVDFYDEKRKPIEADVRAKGEYPYYGASGIIDYVEDYLFDSEMILLSEDGANIIDRNYRVCFLASGKYWVNNHAHVLKAKNQFVNSFVCESLERLSYEQYNTGTAQPKLNQDVCKNIVINVTNETEQTQIGTFFKTLDNLITCHLRKFRQSCLCTKGRLCLYAHLQSLVAN
ncbi:MAG: restriction endonuclease subunit S [Clostridia bacterium]